MVTKEGFFFPKGFLSFTDGDVFPTVTKQTTSKVVLQKQGKGSTLTQGPGNRLLNSKAMFIRTIQRSREARVTKNGQGEPKLRRRGEPERPESPKTRGRDPIRAKRPEKGPKKAAYFFPKKKVGGKSRSGGNIIYIILLYNII